ncbi:Transmembrane transporter OS=Streptomyces glaucescens OX=1907 GN=SGLAU_14790 PE=4 SV=1 [Streptomyces glaucescens]
MGTVFSHGAFRYVHTVIGAVTAAALLVFTLGVVLAPGEAVAPGVVLLIGGVGVAVLGVALIVLVLRMLLAQAVDRDAEAARMQAELAEVI